MVRTIRKWESVVGVGQSSRCHSYALQIQVYCPCWQNLPEKNMLRARSISISEVNEKEQAAPCSYKDLYHSFRCDDCPTLANALTWDSPIWTSDCDFLGLGRRKPYSFSFLAPIQKSYKIFAERG